jgi:hypothetical protein
MILFSINFQVNHFIWPLPGKDYSMIPWTVISTCSVIGTKSVGYSDQFNDNNYSHS